MKKSDRLRAFLDELALPPGDFDPRYAGYFACFNARRYYEAHDVLEDLWLGTRGPDHFFYKGLIQFAGAFVHLQKQAARPAHPKDGARLRPAARLFALAAKNLAPYAPRHHALDVARLLLLASRHADAIIASEFTTNPWRPDHAPQLTLA
jgi:predicted metal-dependent hydrolase